MRLGAARPSWRALSWLWSTLSGARSSWATPPGEAAAQHVLGLDRVGHRVEGGGHLAEFVGGAVLQARGSLAGSEGAHWGGHPAGQEDPDEHGREAAADPREEHKSLDRGPKGMADSRWPGSRHADEGGAGPGAGDHDRNPRSGPEGRDPHQRPVHGRHGPARSSLRRPDEPAACVKDAHLLVGHGGQRVERGERARLPAPHVAVGGGQRGHQLTTASLLLGRDVVGESGPERQVDHHRDERGGPEPSRGESQGEVKRKRPTHRATR